MAYVGVELTDYLHFMKITEMIDVHNILFLCYSHSESLSCRTWEGLTTTCGWS